MQYLTEQRLVEFLQTHFQNVNAQFPVQIGTKRVKVDAELKLGKRQYFFEFNGFRHYTTAKQQTRDNLLRQYCKDNKICLIEFPYFIQLDDQTLQVLSNDDKHINSYLRGILGDIWSLSEYPHGFIDKKALKPCDYNTAGYNLFIKEYTKFIYADAESVAKAIYESLMNGLVSENSGVNLDMDVDLMPASFFTHYPT